MTLTQEAGHEIAKELAGYVLMGTSCLNKVWRLIDMIEWYGLRSVSLCVCVGEEQGEGEKEEKAEKENFIDPIVGKFV